MVKEKNIKVNSILNSVKTIASIIFPLITFPYVSRVLQPDNIGKLNFGSSFVSYFSLIATLGITTYAVRECAGVRSDKQSLGRVASEIFSINICTTIVAYCLLGISLLVFRKLDSYRTLIVIQSTAILFTTLGADWLNTAMEDFVYITIRTIAFQVISLLLMFMLVRSPDDYLKYAVISVISSSGANLLNLFYRRRYCRVRFTMVMRWRVHFMPIVLLFVMILAQTIFNSSDKTMLGLMKGDAELGLYSTAVKIENTIAQVVSSLAWVVMPRISACFIEGDFNRINRMLKNMLGVLFLIGLPLISGVIALAKDIVIIVGGKAYIGSAIPLSILMLSFGFSLLGGSFLGNMVLLPFKQERTYMYICIIATIVNVVLNIRLIPIGGAIAAAGSTAFCSLMMMIMMIITKDKRVRLDYVGKLAKMPLIGAAVIFAYCKVVGCFITLLPVRVVTCICGSILLYAGIMMITKNESLMMMLSAIRRKERSDK